MPKYAPVREDGLKPYVVEISDWGRRRSAVVYGRSAAHARYEALGRKTVGVYATKTRRATPDDLAALDDKDPSS